MSSKSRRGRRRPLLTLKSRKSARNSSLAKELELAGAVFNALPCAAHSIEIQLPVYDTDMPSELFFKAVVGVEISTPDADGFRLEYTRFKCGDDVVFNSERDNTPDAWLGRISQIRADIDLSKVLVKVRWYYSRNDMAEHIKSFNIAQCAPYERIISDTYDYLSPETLQAVARIQEYDDSLLDPPSIGPTDFFVRTALIFAKKIVKPPLGEGTCLCQIAYNPFPEYHVSPSASFSSIFSLSSDRDDSIMHFCPRLGCRKWYHISCLTTMDHVDKESHPSTRGLQLLATDPHKDVAPKDKLDILNALEMFNRSSVDIAHLPPSLLAIAQSPIVRCSGAPDGWAIGNVADVVLARRFVYAAVEHSGAPEATEAFRQMELELDELDALRYIAEEYALMDDEQAVGRLNELCKGLMNFDLLASVYVPYWNRRWGQFVEMQVLLESPALKCPRCSSAI